ncbi:hypothetical protein PAEPH01_1129 [Pancytospora epiphaga]|nr:hypothetical protein PAEPH01_1129 [Pancytospora epiphaga]
MLSKYKLTNMLIIVLTILGSSQVRRSTTMAFPSDSDSDSSEAPSPIVPSTDSETENPKAAGSSTPTPPATASPSDEKQFLATILKDAFFKESQVCASSRDSSEAPSPTVPSVDSGAKSPEATESSKPAPSATASPSGERPSIATILEKAGFKVFSMPIFSREDDTIDDDQVFASLVKQVNILLNEYFSLIKGRLICVLQLIGMLRQGITPMTGDGKYEINREPFIVQTLHVWLASSKLRSYLLKAHKAASLNIANETWDKLFLEVNGIKKFIKTNEAKAGGVDIIMEPFEVSGKSKKRFYTIARILVSIDLIDSIVPRLYEEYRKRLKDSSCTVKLVGKNPNREPYLSGAHKIMRDTTDEATEATVSRIEVDSQCEGRGSLSPHYKLLIFSIIKDLRDRARIIIEDLENTTVGLNNAEYLEYLLCCEVKLKGLMDALESIRKDVNDICCI